MRYTVDHFIRKFEAIPDEQWTIGEYIDAKGRCCAFGHCGVREDENLRESTTQEGEALKALLPAVAEINDDIGDKIGGTPKQRVLNALRRVKAKEVAK